jgi:hypothetical protein
MKFSGLKITKEKLISQSICTTEQENKRTIVEPTEQEKEERERVSEEK